MEFIWCCCFDGDGWVDLVVTNDTQPNFLLRNQGDGNFTESGMVAGIGYDGSGRARAGMGVALTIFWVARPRPSSTDNRFSP